MGSIQIREKPMLYCFEGVGSGAATPVAGGGMRNAGLFSELTLVEGGVIGDWTA